MEEYEYYNDPYVVSSGSSGTSKAYGSTGGSSYTWVSSSRFASSSGFGSPEKKESVPYISGRIERIRLKEEEVWEVPGNPLSRFAAKLIQNSFYGILPFKIKRTKDPEVSGRLKKIKEK